MRKAMAISLFLAVALVSCKTAEFGCRCIDVNGMVYDFGNRAVAGYAVSIGKKTVATDVTGRFTIGKVPAGTHDITGGKDGFERYVGTIDVCDERQIVYIRIPSSSQLLDLADDALAAGDAGKAASAIERAERCDDGSFECRFYRAIAQFRMNDPIAARETLRSMIADGCDDPYATKFLEALGNASL